MVCRKILPFLVSFSLVFFGPSLTHSLSTWHHSLSLSLFPSLSGNHLMYPPLNVSHLQHNHRLLVHWLLP